MRRSYLLTIAILAISQVIWRGPCLYAQRAIPDDNLAYPVLVTIGTTSGSGFYLNTLTDIYLVTAKHVLFEPTTKKLIDAKLTLLSYSRDPKDSAQNVVIADLSVLQSNGDIKSDPSEDVVVVKIAALSKTPNENGAIAMQPYPGVVFSQGSKNGFLGVKLEFVKPFSEVLTGNDVMVFGYPVSLGLQQSPQLDAHRPLLRKGIVAGTNAEKHSIIIDCPSYFGNSGGPVLELDRDGFTTKLSIIGVVIEYVPFVQTGGSQTFVMQFASNSGYSIVASMDVALNLVK